MNWLESQKIKRKSLTSNLSFKRDQFTEREEAANNKASERSELEMVSMNNSFGFRLSFGNFQEAKTVHQVIKMLCACYFRFVKYLNNPFLW